MSKYIKQSLYWYIACHSVVRDLKTIHLSLNKYFGSLSTSHSVSSVPSVSTATVLCLFKPSAFCRYYPFYMPPASSTSSLSTMPYVRTTGTYFLSTIPYVRTTSSLSFISSANNTLSLNATFQYYDFSRYSSFSK